MPVLPLDCHLPTQYMQYITHTITLQQWTNNKTNKSYKQLIYIYISHVNMTQTVSDISPLMPMHQDPLLVYLLGLCSPLGLLPRQWCNRTLAAVLVKRTWTMSVPTRCRYLPPKNQWLRKLSSAPNAEQKHNKTQTHDDVIKWKHLPHYWPFVRGIHRSPVNSQHKGQWRGALMFSLICVWINGWVNNRKAGDLRHYRAHYDVIVMRVLIS